MAEAMDKARHILVIGGGFIGVEFADECRKRGHDVTIGRSGFFGTLTRRGVQPGLSWIFA